jgi:hypothetical protein
MYQADNFYNLGAVEDPRRIKVPDPVPLPD